jgi:hypothetical protein
MLYYEIFLNKGLGNITFGCVPQVVREIIGEPAETEELESLCEGTVESIVWYYPDQGISFFFDAGNGEPTLSSIESENPETYLAGIRIFDKSKDEILSLMPSLGFTDCEEDDETWGEHRLTFEDAQIDFYFLEDNLTLVSWGQ